MTLTARQFHSAFIKETPQVSFNSAFEESEPFPETTFFDGVIEAGFVVLPIHDDVVTDGKAENLKVLKDNRKKLTIVSEINSGYVYTANQDSSLGGLVQTAYQLDECGFSRSVVANHRQTFTGFYFDIYITENITVGIGVHE